MIFRVKESDIRGGASAQVFVCVLYVDLIGAEHVCSWNAWNARILVGKTFSRGVNRTKKFSATSHNHEN